MFGRPFLLSRYEVVRRAEPLHLLAALAAAGSVVLAASIPVRDPDVWWHRWIGEEILATRSVTGLGNDWAPFGDQNWTTTQWLSEALLAVLVRVGGWDLVTGARLAAVAGIAVLLAFALLPGRPGRASVPVYVVVLAGLIPFITLDRPQTLAIGLSVVLAHWLGGLVRNGSTASLWLVLPLTLIWANLHGTWVLVPGVFLLATVAALMSTPQRQELTRLTVATASTLLVGFVTPAGVAGVLAIPRFIGRTSNVIEWQPTTPTSGVSVGLGVLVLMLAWAWARADESVPLATVVIGVGLIGFGLVAIRNVPFALVLLAPIVVESRTRLGLSDYQSGPREQRLLRSATIGVLAVGASAAAVVHTATDATSEAEPRLIAQAIAGEPERVRVLNSYGSAGVLVEFSGNRVELGIDGRADRYPAYYTSAYLAAQRSLVNWQDVVDAVDPDVAVLEFDVALATHLQKSGWSIEMAEGDYVLLRPPPAGD